MGSDLGGSVDPDEGGEMAGDVSKELTSLPAVGRRKAGERQPNSAPEGTRTSPKFPPGPLGPLATLQGRTGPPRFIPRTG